MGRWFWWSIAFGFLVAGGIAGWVNGFGPDSAGRVLLMIGGSWVVVVLGLELVWWRRSRRRAHIADLFAHGTTAPAVVVRVSTTGTGDGFGSLRTALELRVEPPGAEPFSVERTVFVQHNAVPRTGDVLSVAFDPADPDDLVVGDVGTGFSSSQVLDIQRRAQASDVIPDPPDGWQLGVTRGVWIFAAIGFFALWLPYSPGTTRDPAIIVPFSMFGAIFLSIPAILLVRGRLRMVRARRETAMFRTGTRGQGVVTAVDVDSTKVINEVNVPVRFTVDISSPSVAGFTREFAMLLPTRTVPVVGDRIDVALDDHRPPRVALRTDWATNTRGGTTLVLHHGGENDGALQALQDLRERGVLSEDELAAEAHRLGQGGDTR